MNCSIQVWFYLNLYFFHKEKHQSFIGNHCTTGKKKTFTFSYHLKGLPKNPEMNNNWNACQMEEENLSHLESCGSDREKESLWVSGHRLEKGKWQCTGPEHPCQKIWQLTGTWTTIPLSQIKKNTRRHPAHQVWARARLKIIEKTTTQLRRGKLWDRMRDSFPKVFFFCFLLFLYSSKVA